MTRLALVLVAILGFALVGCSKPPALQIDTAYCEHGRAAMGGDCIMFRPEKDADPATIAGAVVKSRSSGLVVKRAGKRNYTLHHDGKIVGSLTHEEEDAIRVTLTDGEPYSKQMRPDKPGGLME